MKHTLRVQSPWFEAIRDGVKTVEGRLATEKFAAITKGDVVVVERGSETCIVAVVATRRYRTFRDMLEHEGLRNVLPSVQNVSAGVSVYREFYSRFKEGKYGVVAIEVAVRAKRATPLRKSS